MTKKIEPFPVLEEDGQFKLLEIKQINNRTLVCWVNTDDSIISLAIFHDSERPNEISQKASLSQWGYPTYFVSEMLDTEEASEIVTLYLKDMMANNFWWEKRLSK